MGLTDLGGGLSWGEAKLLIEAAAEDPSTWFGHILAGWAYPASTPVLISMMAQIDNPKASRAVMPWVMENRHNSGRSATPDEVAAAQAELAKSVVFAS